MPGAVAICIPNSPIFSSPRIPSIYCKPIPSPSVPGPQSPITSSPSSSSSSPSPSSSPKSPLSIVVNEKRLKVNPGTLLKRKRPLRIDIPVMAGGCGFCLETPRGGEEERMEVLEVLEVEEDEYSVYCKRGRRRFMEDRYSASVDARGGSKQAFFGVFDGHGGAKAAEFAAKNLEKNIMAEILSRSEEGIEKAIRNGYLTTDGEFLKQSVSGGACCAITLIHKGNLVVSNAGDCRIVMSRRGVAEALTSDHRPSRKDEKDRIEALGGYVDCCNGIWRIQGCLAVSRGFGDRNLKQWVIAEPETKILKINSDCEFLIMASDGLWDKVSNQEAVDLVRSLCIGVDKPEPLVACKKLTELSLRRGCVDDTSVMIIQLEHFKS